MLQSPFFVSPGPCEIQHTLSKLVSSGNPGGGAICVASPVRGCGAFGPTLSGPTSSARGGRFVRIGGAGFGGKCNGGSAARTAHENASEIASSAGQNGRRAERVGR